MGMYFITVIFVANWTLIVAQKNVNVLSMPFQMHSLSYQKILLCTASLHLISIPLILKDFIFLTKSAQTNEHYPILQTFFF